MTKPVKRDRRHERGPVSVSKFIDIHQGKMNSLYREGIIESDDLQFEFREKPIVMLVGSIKFPDSPVELKVTKYLLIERVGKRDCLVTKRYSYQCCISGQSNSEIFRRDNYHEESPHDGHDGPHHVHIFDPPGKQVLGSPFEVKDEDRPLMDEIIREAYRQSEAYKATQAASATAPRRVAAKAKRSKRR